jgi:hypothetical protein
VSRFDQQEERDLRDVRPRRDVRQIVFTRGIERVAAREVAERAVRLLQIPGVGDLHDLELHGRLWRHLNDVRCDIPGEALEPRAV